MKRLPFIDLHQDLLLHIHERNTIGQNVQTDFDLIKRNSGKIVTATAFPFPPDENYFDPVTNDLIERDFHEYRLHAQTHPDWRIVKNADDVRTVLDTPDATGLILHIEGLNVVSGEDFPRLERWYDLGWRSLGIVWNLTNPLGGGTNDLTQGLTPLGRDVITWLQKRRMIVDFAHMNNATFRDAAAIVDGPIMISHGNTCALCPSPRNYTDDQLRAVAETDGVIGVFFAKTYVTGRDLPGTLADAVNHIDHIRKVIGIDHIALGTDFGGIISGTLAGLDSIDRLPDVWRELSRREYRDNDIERIAYKNAARVLTTIL